jgi:glycosyltransferase involved in cell wall biosynthesis
MKRLFVDARCLGSGIGVYATNLLAGLQSFAPPFSTTAITGPQYESRLRPLCDGVVTVGAPIYSAREQVQIPWVARAADLLHVTHYNVPLAHKRPMVVSIHDLTHILDSTHARTFKSWIYARPMLTYAAQHSNHVFTLSSYSRDRIVEHLGIPASKITITYVGVGAQFQPVPRESYQELCRELGLSRRYLLFVGNLKPHKNVSTLLQAHAQVCRAGVDCDLVIVGDDPRGRGLVRREIDKLQTSDRVRIFPTVPLDSLVNLYAGAQVLVLPSFEEGFGLPVAEAMACGTPVVCSRAASLPEVGGDAVEYFDPRSSADLAERLIQLLESPEKQARMRQMGFVQARRFTWSDCAQRHYDVYRQFLC